MVAAQAVMWFKFARMPARCSWRPERGLREGGRSKARCSQPAGLLKAPQQRSHSFWGHPVASIRNAVLQAPGGQTPSVKGPRANISGFAGHAQVHHGGAETAADAMQTNGCGCEPIIRDTEI